MNEEIAVLHVSDWNYRDKYYEAPISLIKEFKKRVGSDLKAGWAWWAEQVDYDQKGNKPVKFGTVNMNSCIFFFDYNDHKESLSEWEFD